MENSIDPMGTTNWVVREPKVLPSATKSKDQGARNGYVIGYVQGLLGSESVPEGGMHATFNLK